MVRHAGISRATIYHYINRGLLDRPKKKGLINRRFDQTHLSRLKQIRELREEKKLSLSVIKAILSRANDPAVSLKDKDIDRLTAQAFEKEKQTKDHEVSVKKKHILDTAIELFSKKGFDNTTIDAIAQALNIGKGTVYHYFESKEDLFIECISRLTVIALPKEFWDEIHREKDYFLRHRKRLEAFLTAFPSYRGILAMNRVTLTGENYRLAMKAKETLQLMSKSIADDFRIGMKSGVLRQFNKELVSYMVLAVGETIGSLLMMDSGYKTEELVNAYLDFINYGTAKRKNEDDVGEGTATGPCEVTDLNGITTLIKHICFGEQSVLPGKMGDAEIRINPEKMKRLRFEKSPTAFMAEVTTQDNETIRIETNGDLMVSGVTSYGTYNIQLSNINHILFRGS